MVTFGRSVRTCESSVFMRVRKNRTAFHLRPFERLCQLDFFGFHRFFTVFFGFSSSRGQKSSIFPDFWGLGYHGSGIEGPLPGCDLGSFYRCRRTLFCLRVVIARLSQDRDWRHLRSFADTVCDSAEIEDDHAREVLLFEGEIGGAAGTEVSEDVRGDGHGCEGGKHLGETVWLVENASF